MIATRLNSKVVNAPRSTCMKFDSTKFTAFEGIFLKSFTDAKSFGTKERAVTIFQSSDLNPKCSNQTRKWNLRSVSRRLGWVHFSSQSRKSIPFINSWIYTKSNVRSDNFFTLSRLVLCHSTCGCSDAKKRRRG